MLKNKPACIFLATALGIGLASALGNFIPVLGFAILTAAALILKKRFFALLAACTLLGSVALMLNTPRYSELALEQATVTGYVSEQVKDGVYNLRDVEIDGQQLNKMVRLHSEQPLFCGDVVRVSGQVRPFSPATNFGGVDWQKVMLGKDISHTVFAASVQVTGSRTNAFTFFGGMKEQITSSIDYVLGEDRSALVKGILFGEKSAISEDTLADFRGAGISHVLAISGLHIGILVAALCWLLRKARKGIQLLTVGGVLLCFLFLTCWSPSVVRASLMAGLWLFAAWKGYRYNLLTSLFAAGVIILLANPYHLFTAGFLLSFTCVLGIGLFYRWLFAHLCWFARPIRVSLAMCFACQIGMLPVQILFFNQIQTYGFLANIFAVPLVSVALIAALLGVIALPFGLAFVPLVFSYSLLEIVSYIAKVVSAMPGAVINIPTPPLTLVLLYYGLLSLLCIWFIRRKQAVIAAGAVSLSVMLLVNFQTLSHTPQITMLDVGDGLCIDIRTSRGKHILIDGGKSAESENDVIKYLRSEGANHLTLINTHPDRDHYGGFLPVSREFRVDAYLSPSLEGDGDYSQLIATLRNKHADVQPFLAGSTLELDGARIEAIAPSAIKDGKNENSLNAYVIIKTSSGEKTLLITGDTPIEDEVDYRRVDILQVPHHGSDTSTSPAMLTQTRPEISLVSGDKYMQRSVTDRLGHYYDTKRFGAVRLRLTDTIQVETMK